MTGQSCLSIPWRVLSWAGLFGMGALEVGLLIWVTWCGGPDIVRTWVLLLSAPTAAWMVLHGEACRMSRLRQERADMERLAEVLSMDPGR